MLLACAPSSPLLLSSSRPATLPPLGGTTRMSIAGVKRRIVPVALGGAPALSLHVVEVADWGWWERASASPTSNPYGAKLWPASLAVAEYLAALPPAALKDLTVLELGCGNGLCAMVAAARGAASVTASDLSEDALQLTREAVTQQGLPVELLRFDLGDPTTPLPPADLVIAADLLYDDTLATHVARRVAEAHRRGSWTIVGDARRAGRLTFEQALRQFCAAPLTFVPCAPVRLAAVGWKQKNVDLLFANTPSFLAETPAP